MASPTAGPTLARPRHRRAPVAFRPPSGPAPAPSRLAPVGPAPVGPAPVGPAPVGPAPVGPAPVGPAPVGRAPVGPAPVGRAPGWYGMVLPSRPGPPTQGSRPLPGEYRPC